MPTQSVYGIGPFEFRDSLGRLVSVPLSALQFNNGTLEVKSAETNWTALVSTDAVHLLPDLQQQDIFTPES